MKNCVKIFLFLAAAFFAVEAAALPFNRPSSSDGIPGMVYKYDLQHDKYNGGIGFSHGSNPPWNTMATYQNAGNAMNLFYNQWRDGILRATTKTGGLGYIGRCTDYGCWAEGGPGGDTNYILQSRLLSNAAWTLTNATNTNTSIVGADAVSGNGNKVTFTGANGTVKQAITFTAKLDLNNKSTIVTPGTLYVANNVLTLNDGCATHGKITVNSVSVGGVLTTTNTTAGSCASIPANPVTVLSVAGGTQQTGTGATFNPFYRTGTPSAWVKCVTCTGAIYIDGDNCADLNDISAGLLTTQYLQVRGPTTQLSNNTLCIQGANANDVIDVDFTQFEDDDQATSPIVTTAATITRGPENYYLGYTGSVYNAGYQLAAAIQAGTPFSMVFVYSGNFSTTLHHSLWTTDGPLGPIGSNGPGSSPISFVLSGSGGTSVTSTNSDVTGLYLTSPGNTGTVNKVAVSANGTTLMVCVNGVLTSGAGHFQPSLAGVTHSNILNNGSNLVPVNGWMSILDMTPREMTAGECIAASTVVNNQ